MRTLIQDLRYAARMLLKMPGFSLVAVLTLALGIGATTAIFTVVNGVLLKPLPYADAGRLVMVWEDLRARGGPADEWLTPGNYADLRAERGLFDGFAVLTGWRPTLSGGAEPEPLSGERVSHEYFSVLGVTPAIGRTFRPEDDAPNAPLVAVIGDGLWRRRFGANPSVAGTTITLNGEAHQIVGVLPPGFRPVIVTSAEIWRPLRTNLANPSRGAIVLRSVARLAHGVDLPAAQSGATTIAKRLEAAYPQYNEKTGFNLTPLKDRVVGDVEPALVALFGAVAFVLLIACANIANLLLARGSGRGRELAVRMALGAGRGRMIRQMLTESLLLAAIGGVGGVILGVWALDALVAMAPAGSPRLEEIGLDRTVFAFAAIVTLATGVLFGLVPALQASRSDVTHSLKDGGRGTSPAAGRRVRHALIAAEVALALMLLTGGGLLLQTFVRLQSADLGFDPRNVLVAFVNPPRATYGDVPKLRAYHDAVLEKVSALPGIEAASLASVLPLSGDSDTSFSIEGRPAPASQSETPVTWYREVSADYFDAMGIKLHAGRAFTRNESLPSVVVNESFARKFFPGDNAIGRRIKFGRDDPWFTIVGIAVDGRPRGARRESIVETYVPYWQQTEPGMNIVIRTSGNPMQLQAALKSAVSSVDATIPVQGIGTLSRMVNDSIDLPRFVASLSVAFALIALALAAIGIYGVMAYSVSQRTTELGVRMALGARRREVFTLVVRDGLRLTLVGVVIGAAGSFAVGKWLAAQLYGVTPSDPVTLAATSAAIVLVAITATALPARRATAVDPMVALRAD